MGTVHWIGIQIQCPMETHCFETTFNLIWIKLKKYLVAEGSSGSNGWARVKRERTYSREPLLRTIFLIHVTCKLNAEGQHETKVYEHWQCQWKKPEFTILISVSMKSFERLCPSEFINCVAQYVHMLTGRTHTFFNFTCLLMSFARYLL